MIKNMNFIELKIKNAHELLEETHNYIRWQAPLDVEGMSREDIFKVSCEAMRVTVRLTQIMGWLLLQKAIVDGEISREESFSDSFPLLQGKSCLESSGESDPHLPIRLRELLKKSREFYLHTKVLEELSLKDTPLPEEIKVERAKGYSTVPSFVFQKDRK